MNNLLYAGNKTPTESWEMLSTDPISILIDVRTNAEWAFVGVPDLSSIEKEALLISWQIFPEMSENENFIGKVTKIVSDRSAPLLFMCRSGVRSHYAAEAMTIAGFTKCFNILEGFEGDKNRKNHRGKTGGWKFSNLPWKQS